MFPSFQQLPLTYIFTGLFFFVSVLAFYYRPLYVLLVYHPATVFKGKHIHTLFTSGFIHRSWKHLLLNIYVFFTMARDVEYIILEKHYGTIQIRIIFLLLLVMGIAGPNFIQGITARKDIAFNAVGASTGACAFLGFAMLYLPFDHPLKTNRFLPIYYGYEFALAFLVLFILLALLFKKSKTNHNGHLIGLMIGFALAVIFNPGLVVEIICQAT